MKLKRIGTMLLVAALTLGQSYGMSLPVRAAETDENTTAIFSVADESEGLEFTAEDTSETVTETGPDTEIISEADPETDTADGKESSDDAAFIDDDTETEETDPGESEIDEEIAEEEVVSEKDASSKLFADTEYYGLWVGGVQVNSENKSDLTSAITAAGGNANGTITYDPDTYTLTFENAELSGGYHKADGDSAVIAIPKEYAGQLKIKFSGTNTIRCNTSYSCAIRCIATDLTFEGSEGDEMYVYSYSGSSPENGAIGPKSLTVNGGTVYAIAPYVMNTGNLSAYVPYSIFINGSSDNVNLTVNSGRLIAKGWAPLVTISEESLNNNTMLYGSVNEDGSGLEEYDFANNGYWSNNLFVNTYRYVEAVPYSNAEYPLYISGTQVTGRNAPVLSRLNGVTVGEGGSLRYFADTNTLYFKNVTISDDSESSDWAGVQYIDSDKLTLYFEGNNTIQDMGVRSEYSTAVLMGDHSWTNGNNEVEIILADDASVNLKGGKIDDNSQTSVGFSSSGKLAIRGSGTISFFGGELADGITDSGYSAGIEAYHLDIDLEGENSAVYAVGQASGYSIGVSVSRCLQLRKGLLDVRSESGTETYGIYYSPYGSYDQKDINIDGGELKVTAIGNSDTTKCIGIFKYNDNDKVIINGGKVTVSADSGTDMVQAINMEIALGDGISAKASKNSNGSAIEVYDPAKITEYKYFTAPAEIEVYPLYICGTQVTNANAADLSVINEVELTEDGYFYYDADSNTLYMKGVVITGSNVIRDSIWAGINYTGTGLLTIWAEGANCIMDTGRATDSYGIVVGSVDTASLDIVLADPDTHFQVVSGKASIYESVAINVSGILTVVGSGKLQACASDSTGGLSAAIKTNDFVADLEDSGSISAYSGTASASVGIFVTNIFRLKNGKVFARADSSLKENINYGVYFTSFEHAEKTVLLVEGGFLEAGAIGKNQPWISMGICGNYELFKISITGGQVIAYSTAETRGTSQAINMDVELGEDLKAGGAKGLTDAGWEMEDYNEDDRNYYRYFEAPYADWGEIPTKLQALFDDIDNVPSGVWYAIEGDEVIDGPLTTDATISGRTYYAEKLTFNNRIWVFHGTRRLWENRDYTVKYANNLNAAEATAAKAPSVTITGKGSYSSAVTFKFAIKPASIEHAYITSLKSVTVAPGTKLSTVKPAVSFLGSKLTLNKDYTLKYYSVDCDTETEVPATTAVVKDATYRIRIFAKEGGNFKDKMIGSDYVDVTGVDAKDTTKTAISKVKVTVPKASALPYIEKGYKAIDLFDNRDEKAPKITVTFNNKPLIYDTDFYVDNVDLISAGKDSVAIHGIGAFVGDKMVTIEIGGIPASKVKVACMATTVEYNGKAFAFNDEDDINALYKKDSTNFDKVTLYTVENGQKVPLKFGDDYFTECTYNGSVGKMVVYFTLVNKYTGTIKKTVTIKARSIKDANVNASTVEYTKAGAEPNNVVVTLDGGATVLREGIDYKLSYKNNKKPANATGKKTDPTVVVKGIGNYSGTANGYFTIEKALISHHVGLDIADKVFKDKKDYYKSVPKIMDNGKAISVGKNKDIDAKPAAYKYYTVDDKGKLVEIPEGTVVQAPTLIVVKAEVHCGANSPYQEGDYTIMGTYKIIANGNNISKAKVALKNPDVQFNNGNDIDIDASDLTVTLNGQTLTPGTDYDIVGTPKKIRFLGAATVTIRGNGFYGGTKKFTFKIKAKNMRN